MEDFGEFSPPDKCQASVFGYGTPNKSDEYRVTAVCGERQVTISTGRLYDWDREPAAAKIITGFCVDCPNIIGSATLIVLPSPEDASAPNS